MLTCALNIADVGAFQADLAWNELVSSLKSEAYAADEACNTAQLALKPTQETNKTLAASLTTAEELLTHHKVALRSLASDLGAGTAAGAAEQGPRELSASVSATFRSKLNTALEEVAEAQSETESVQRELERVRRDLR